MSMTMTEFLIVAGSAFVVALAVRLIRARIAARKRPPDHIHGALMKQAAAHADKSPFLRKVCREFEANSHISDRQAEQVAKALERLAAKSST